jgi:hypothetical protein
MPGMLAAGGVENSSGLSGRFASDSLRASEESRTADTRALHFKIVQFILIF